jgi:hypothetical protein
MDAKRWYSNTLQQSPVKKYRIEHGCSGEWAPTAIDPTDAGSGFSPVLAGRGWDLGPYPKFHDEERELELGCSNQPASAFLE